jgi:hypothetical protein
MVNLHVTYDVLPFTYDSGVKTTDGNGNASLTWNVKIMPMNTQITYVARVTATGFDQNGKTVSTNTVTVTVTL